MRKARLEYQRRNARRMEEIKDPVTPSACITRRCVLVGLNRFVEAIRNCVELRNCDSLISYYRDGALVAQIVWLPHEAQSRCEHRLFL